MTPQDFVRKWRTSNLREDQASQTHFNDLCAMLGEPSPAEADPAGTWYCFEAGAKKTGGGDGWADVWKKGCFAWEYKGKHKDLNLAFAQLQRYAIALQNPPLLVVSDMDTIRVHTNFTNTVEEIHCITLDDLLKEESRRLLKAAFVDPEALKPGTTREQLTEEAAAEFANLAQSLHARGYEPRRVAHFINKVLFCLFAEDIGILPQRLFTRLLEASARRPERFHEMAQRLFAAMKDGGDFDLEVIEWFNGGLFADDEAFPLDREHVELLRRIARLDWSAVEPAIFGTLFERGLDPSKRSQLGAHYTDRGSIMRIVEPVVLEPLRTEWARVRAEVDELLDAPSDGNSATAVTPDIRLDWTLSREQVREMSRAMHRPSARAAVTKRIARAKEKCREFLYKLQNVRVLDPACGSGNFLYLALRGLKDLERQVLDEIEQLGLQPMMPAVGPQCVMGIEINPYAAELARITVWIGQIQWMLNNGFGLARNPILQSLDQISCRDALLDDDGNEAEWPPADFIVGNPPFLGDKKMISELGEQYASSLRRTYKGRVPGGADLVTYWYHKAWNAVAGGKAEAAGLVATNSIRGGQNRRVLDRICAEGEIFEAWSDEPWVVEGAAVRVSILCFSKKQQRRTVRLNGAEASAIHADLTGVTHEQKATNLTTVRPLPENAGVIFMGTTKVGAFDVDGTQAREWLTAPGNPNRCPNSDVIRPWANSMDVTRRWADKWIVDFGATRTEAEAELYEAPFEYVSRAVKPERMKNRRNSYARLWWLHGEPRPAMRQALAPLRRYIATPSVAKHRVFVFLNRIVLPDHQLFAICREDYTTFGILHSRFHEAWSLRLGTSLEDRPRYTPTTTFETFPFPDGLTPNVPAPLYANDARALAIATAAKKLDDLRESWLNPRDLILCVPEVVPGFPDRVMAKDEQAAAELRKRTLTNLYNARPMWLVHAHRDLDAAVARAYGWPENISEDDALRELSKLNCERARAFR